MATGRDGLMAGRESRSIATVEEDLPRVRPTRRAPLSQIILDQIAELIVRRVWKPGNLIPSEKELALRFGVGRSTIREVLQSLVVLGVIEIRAGEGSFVREPSTELLSGAFRWSLLLSDTNVEDLIETRALVELECAARAAKAPTEDAIHELEYLHRKLIEHLADHKAFTEWDNRFHLQIATMAHNVLLRNIANTVQIIGRTWYPVTYTMNDTKSLTVGEHKRILDAISRRNCDGARDAMRLHLKEAGWRLKRSLARLTPDAQTTAVEVS